MTGARASEATAAAMNSSGPERVAFIDGIALWTPAWPSWDAAARALRGDDETATSTFAAAMAAPHAGAPARAAPSTPTTPTPPTRPQPAGLAPNERRRAPDSVLIALQVAEQAVAMSGHARSALASVFTSAHGDLPIVDALARTLAADPRLLSPTRFHHSVHNAPSGYWAMASGSHAASTALAAFDHSFGAGLLEALVQVACDEAPVLLAGCDTEAAGPLASVNTSRGLLGVALVLAPRAGPRSRFALRWTLAEAAAANPAIRSAAARSLATNALADALPLAEALARAGATSLELRCGSGAVLRVALQPCAAPG